MRRYTGTHKICFQRPHRSHLLEQLLKVFPGEFRIGPERLLVHDAAQSDLLERFHRLNCERTRIAETRDAGASRFNHATRGARSEGTRLNSSHRCISYAVLCLKKKK